MTRLLPRRSGLVKHSQIYKTNKKNDARSKTTPQDCQKLQRWKAVALGDDILGELVCEGFGILEELETCDLPSRENKRKGEAMKPNNEKKKRKMEITNQPVADLTLNKEMIDEGQSESSNDIITKKESEACQNISSSKVDSSELEEDNARMVSGATTAVENEKTCFKYEENWEIIGMYKHSMKDWLSLVKEFPPTVLVALAGAGFTTPTPIQQAVLPEAIDKRRDIVAAAETGSGKTLAFGVPIVSNILHAMKVRQEKSLPPVTGYLEAMILLPSRELASQVDSHLCRITGDSPIQVACIIGGMSLQKQLRILDKTKPQIVVATPGRLFAFMGGFDPETSGSLEKPSEHLTHLEKLRYLALDEADRFTEAGHFKEVTSILKQIYTNLESADQLQTFIFSATLALPARQFAMRRKKSRSQKKSKKVKLEGNNNKTSTDEDQLQLGNMSGAMKALFEKIKLRPKKLFAIDLTTTSAAQPESDDLNKKKNVVEKKAIDLKLPDRLTLSMIRCVEKDKEVQLYAFLSHYYFLMGSSYGSKILIFVNAISYVQRLEPLFQILFQNKKLQSFKKHLNKPITENRRIDHLKSQNPVKKKSAATTVLESPGVSLLSEYLQSGLAQSKDKSTTEEELQKRKNDPTLTAAEATPDSNNIDEEVNHSSFQTKSTQHRKYKKEGIVVEIIGIHSRLKQSQRLKRLERFQKPTVNSVLICTDVAARGLDLPNVDVVIHAQPPRTSALFVHRSGRTARANKDGQCVCLCGPEDVKQWSSLLKAISRDIDNIEGPSIMTDVTSKQITALQEIYKLAHVTEEGAHKVRKYQQENEWLKKAAEDVDLICDELIPSNDAEDQVIDMLERRGVINDFESKRLTLESLLQRSVWN